MFRRFTGKIIVPLTVFCLSLSGMSTVLAGWPEKAKLSPSDPYDHDQFGRAVSISGDYAVVGAHYDDDNGGASGSAYVFIREGGSWSQQHKLTADDGQASDFFGYTVDIDGETLVVGAYGDDDNGSSAGSVYVFTRSGTTWTQQDKLLADDGDASDSFGRSVSVSGDTVVVGADLDEALGTGSGSAYVFIRSGENWTQQQKLTAFDAADNDRFGGSVAIDGETLIVGAYSDDDTCAESGSVYVFVRSGGTWSFQQKLNADVPVEFAFFGTRVDLDGDYAAIGAIGLDDPGSAYVFKRAVTTWSQQDKLTASDGATDDDFGCAIGISGEWVVVGAYYDDNNGENSGSAYIFKRDGVSWSEHTQLLASDGAEGDQFGISAAVDGNYAIVGANLDDEAGANFGTAFIFGYCPDWLTADLTGDCFVDIADFAVFVSQWLEPAD